ncbi:tetrahydrofolate dehydrogenase/cyclohydrolase [Lucifera butyrica]|uniref:Bifunctional protein FolD n=1 Tax=Lucifera butyrica TaxID=1351585 RepID=A0A498R548_9FIRM|nr:bifunctional methylenetetrahydrofolate dehydrogenase/methenyltetrahydrofolate cyclohydrolase FolD [Lucifera butyrica]VBB06269.1 tetrahydrofolate dehydrogenase/cyclohydrolase [Lucifera butyrica]
MTAKILDGNWFAGQIRERVRNEVVSLQQELGITPGLAVIIVGDNPASQVYVNRKHKACGETGIHSVVIRLAEQTTQNELLQKIEELNRDGSIHGILVQLPLPAHIDEMVILQAISPAKDVDGFHPFNMGSLAAGRELLVPCTPAGIVRLLEMAGIDLEGKRAVIIGRSNIVGKPMALLLLSRNATVTVCHSRTRELAAIAREADILIAAVGKPGFVKPEMVKPGAVVIDVGINRVEGKLAGDVDFPAVREVAGAITPVPGGVGPLTISMLLANTVKAVRLLQPTAGVKAKSRVRRS